eukprot:gene11640-biopygen9314
MASWTANIPQVPGRGPSVITIHGSAYRRTARLGPLPGQQPKYAIYNPTNRDLNKDTNKKLQDELLAVNPYAQEYKNIGDILQQQKEQATAANEPIPTFDMIITSRANQDRRYDTPAASEIAAIYSTKDGGAPDPNERTMQIQRRDGYLINIKATNPVADPLTYPLLFLFGEHGWGTTIARVPSARSQIPADQAERRQTRVTPNQFYTYRTQVREGFSALHLSRLLFQQYLVDAFTKIEGNDLAYIRYHQKDLRVESYKGLMDHLYRRAEQQNLIAQAHNPGAAQHTDVGRVIILPSTFTGSQRNMQQNYQDAMTIVRKHGKPDLFLTFTANPNWQDILDNLLPNQKPQDRPDIVTRVFHLKFKQLLCDILDLNFFGKVIAYVYTVEFQKRGLRHTHMIISLANEDKPRTPEHVDRIILAEIPDENTHVHEHRIVKKHMMHGPCGILNPSCVCMQDGKCKKKFPKDLTQQTEFNVNGYPLYRRRGQTTAQLRQHRLNNSWVVPHNLKLLLKFDCHMNVEVCTTVKSVKYIFKYIHKGNDMAHIEIREGHEEANARQDIVHDEIRQYMNSRYVGPHQAVYKLMQYEMHDKSHTIIRLAIHLPHQQPVYFTHPEQAAQRNTDSMLMAYFSLNQREENAHRYLYQDIPEHYTYNKSAKQWQQRKRRSAKGVIGRIYNVLLSDPERFALRLILLHRKGATSFKDIRTVDGITHNTFKNAARAMSLLEDDAEHRRCLQDAVVFHLPAQMRKLFATLILFQTPSDIHALFTEFQEDMAEDYARHGQLQDPNTTFQQVGATIILLRNINPAKGLCNGTRLIVRDLKRHIITAEIITTQNKGQLEPQSFCSETSTLRKDYAMEHD